MLKLCLSIVLLLSVSPAMALNIEYNVTSEAWTDLGQFGIACAGPARTAFHQSDSIEAPPPSDPGLTLVWKDETNYFEPPVWAQHTWVKLAGTNVSAKVVCQRVLRPVWRPD